MTRWHSFSRFVLATCNKEAIFVFLVLDMDWNYSVQWKLVRGHIIKRRWMSFAFEKTPHIGLSYRQAPLANIENTKLVYHLSFATERGDYFSYGLKTPSRLFPSYVVPLFQIESSFKAFQIKMSWFVGKLTSKGKVCIPAKWLTRPELIPVFLAWND